MDPDVTLKELRQLLGAWQERELTDMEQRAAFTSMISLDNWMTFGGFPPAGWEKKAGRHRK